jgi:hypothetical protein
MSRKNFPVLSAVLYVLAGLLALYTAWAAYHSFTYISTMIDQGQLMVSGNVFEIVNFHMTNFAQYGLLAVIIFTLGWIVQFNSSYPIAAENQGVFSDEILDDEDEEDVEDWLEDDDK